MNESTVVPISALEHYEYCARQCALIHVDGQWVDNTHTVRGQYGHRRADAGGFKRERGAQVYRSLPLWSEEWGLTGRADVIEVRRGPIVVPIEYKIGVGHQRASEVQLCAQILCLEEMLGLSIEYGQIWQSSSRRRWKVPADRDLRTRTVTSIIETRKIFEQTTLPRAVNDARCKQCQFQPSCLPDLVADAHRVSAYLRDEAMSCRF